MSVQKAHFLSNRIERFCKECTHRISLTPLTSNSFRNIPPPMRW